MLRKVSSFFFVFSTHLNYHPLLSRLPEVYLKLTLKGNIVLPKLSFITCGETTGIAVILFDLELLE